MGYDLTLFQTAYIVERFFGGAPLRRIALDFRNNFGLPISAATILRRVVEIIKTVDGSLRYLMDAERTETGHPNFGFTPVLGDIWEIDEIYLQIGRKRFPLIVVKDLKTCFIVAAKLAKSTTIKTVSEVLVCARETANKYPRELRGDGHPAYPRAVKCAFGRRTKLTIHKKVGQMGQDQSIEGTFGSAIRSRIKRMRSLHSLEKSPIIIRGLILDYLFARPCEALNGQTPAELAMAWNPIDGKRGWPALLQLAKHYGKIRFPAKKKGQVCVTQRQTTLDESLLVEKKTMKKGRRVPWDRNKQLQLGSFLT